MTQERVAEVRRRIRLIAADEIEEKIPSQQNTSTGRLTQEMLDAIFARAASIIQLLSSKVPAGL